MPKYRRLFYANLSYLLMSGILLLVSSLSFQWTLQPYSAAFNALQVALEFVAVALPPLLLMRLPADESAQRVGSWPVPGTPLLRVRMSLRPDEAKGGWWRAPGVPLLLVVPLSLCAYFFINGVTVLWLLLLGAISPLQSVSAVPLPANGGQLGMSLLVIALVPAAVEEYAFRGVLLPQYLKRGKPWAGIVLCGCLFGLMHGQTMALPGHVLLGIGLSYAVWATRSVWTGVLWHFLQNGTAMVIGYFSSQLQSALPQFSQGMADPMDAFIHSGAQMLLSGLFLTLFFGLMTAGLLVALHFAGRPARARHPLPAAEGKPPLWVYWPLLAALLIQLYRYVLDALTLFGALA